MNKLTKIQETNIIQQLIHQGPVQDVFNEIDIKKYKLKSVYLSSIPSEVIKWLGGDYRDIATASLESDDLPKVVVKIGRLIETVSKEKDPLKEIQEKYGEYRMFNFEGCRIVHSTHGPGGFFWNVLDTEELLKFAK